MTAQIGDDFTYEKERYSIIAASEDIEFCPEEYGIIPESVCTACWAGYWCEYSISKAGLVLRNLHVHSLDDHYPAINGVKADENDDSMGNRVYKHINLPMQYTGKLVLGNGFIRDYYIHMGYQRAWAYNTVLEFDFKDGALQKVIDHSKVAEKIRAKIDENPKEFYEAMDGNIAKFVEDSFSKDMKVKAWWIE